MQPWFILGASVAPPAITVAVSGLDATITNTGGAADAINWGDGTTNALLTHTYAYGGVYTVTASNAGGSSAATFAANDVPMLLITQSYNAGGKLWQNAAKTVAAVADGDPVRVATCPVTGVDYVALSDSARPLLWEAGDGNWELYFDGIDDAISRAVTWAGTVGSQATGFIFLGTQPIQVVQDGNTVSDYYSFGGSGYANVFRLSRIDLYGPNPVDSAPHVYCEVSGADYRIFADGVQTGSSSTDWRSPIAIEVGKFVTSSFEGLVAATIWSKSGWTTTERNNVESFIAALNTI